VHVQEGQQCAQYLKVPSEGVMKVECLKVASNAEKNRSNVIFPCEPHCMVCLHTESGVNAGSKAQQLGG
jgi:hypothetical protein